MLYFRHKPTPIRCLLFLTPVRLIQDLFQAEACLAQQLWRTRGRHIDLTWPERNISFYHGVLCEYSIVCFIGIGAADAATHIVANLEWLGDFRVDWGDGAGVVAAHDAKWWGGCGLFDAFLFCRVDGNCVCFNEEVVGTLFREWGRFDWYFIWPSSVVKVMAFISLGIDIVAPYEWLTINLRG